jgi:hypothetical protein
LGRVYNPNRPGKERERLLKVIVVVINELHSSGVGSSEFEDLSAFLLLSLTAVCRSIEKTTTAWEKRGYWIKADRFRLEWMWLDSCITKLDRELDKGNWSSIINVSDEILRHLDEVPLLRKHRYGKPWLGAYSKYKNID